MARGVATDLEGCATCGVIGSDWVFSLMTVLAASMNLSNRCGEESICSRTHGDVIVAVGRPKDTACGVVVEESGTCCMRVSGCVAVTTAWLGGGRWGGGTGVTASSRGGSTNASSVVGSSQEASVVFILNGVTGGLLLVGLLEDIMDDKCWHRVINVGGVLQLRPRIFLVQSW